jgi:hypothetical protein
VNSQALWLDTKHNETNGYAAFSVEAMEHYAEMTAHLPLQRLVEKLPEETQLCYALHSQPLPDKELQSWVEARSNAGPISRFLAQERVDWLRRSSSPARVRHAYVFIRIALRSAATMSKEEQSSYLRDSATDLAQYLKLSRLDPTLLSGEQLDALGADIERQFTIAGAQHRPLMTAYDKDTPVALHLNLDRAPQAHLADALFRAESNLQGAYWAWTSVTALDGRQSHIAMGRTDGTPFSWLGNLLRQEPPLHTQGDIEPHEEVYRTACHIALKGQTARITDTDALTLLRELRRSGFSPTVSSKAPEGWLPFEGEQAHFAERNSMLAQVSLTSRLLPSLAHIPKGPLASGGALLRANDGTLQAFDPFQGQSADTGRGNFVVSGSAGSGASFFCKEVLTAHVSGGNRACVISATQDFSKMADALNGVSVELSPRSRQSLNIFSLIQSFDHLILNLTKLTRWVATLIRTRKSEAWHQPLTYLQMESIKSAIVDAWRHSGSNMDLKAVQSSLRNPLDGADRSTRYLADQLERYVSGVYTTLFSGKMSFPADEQLVVFDTQAYWRSEIGPVVNRTLCVWAALRWSEVGDTSTKKLLLVDEVDSIGRFEPVGLMEAVLSHFQRKNVIFGLSARPWQLVEPVDKDQGSVLRDAIMPTVSRMVILRGSCVDNLALRETYFPELEVERIIAHLHTGREKGASLAIADLRTMGFGVFSFQVDPVSLTLLNSSSSSLVEYQQRRARGLSVEDALRKLDN